MEILLATPYFPPHIGGVEFHVRYLASNLSKKHRVRVISSKGDCETVPSINIPYSPIPISFPRIRADIYHSHVPSPFFAHRIFKLGLDPHIITYHNDVAIPQVVNGLRIPGILRKTIERINEKILTPVLESCDVIIATTRSYALTSPVLSRFMDKVVIVPNGVDTEKFTPGIRVDEREQVVLYVGRLVEYKGLTILLKAMSEVQRFLDAKLVVVGEGEDRKRFERFAERLAINAVFTGKLPDFEVQQWMKRARVLVLPSFSRLEAFGMVLLESMASGTPVIASSIPGVRDVAADGGLVFSDTEDLSQKIMFMLEDDRIALKLSRKGLKAVNEKYSWDKVSENIEKIYLKVV
jgi:glycosyltransferase involved in cell wall biosynthesis